MSEDEVLRMHLAAAVSVRAMLRRVLETIAAEFMREAAKW